MVRMHLFLWLMALLPAASGAQDVRILKPRLGHWVSLTEQEEQRWRLVLEDVRQIDAGKLNYDSLGPEQRRMIDSLEQGGGPVTQDIGCSWYCGGELTQVSASSHRAPFRHTTYAANNLHDFNLLTAWLPDSLHEGVGQKLRFAFAPFSPRVNTIVVYNGYNRNATQWAAHARAKTMKLYINGAYYAILLLEDSPAAQSFTIDPVRSAIKGKDLEIVLEITALYPGKTYPQVAISEINFDGLDVH